MPKFQNPPNQRFAQSSGGTPGWVVMGCVVGKAIKRSLGLTIGAESADLQPIVLDLIVALLLQLLKERV